MNQAISAQAVDARAGGMKTLLVMAGGTGGGVFGFGRAVRLTFATLTLAYAEYVSARTSSEARGHD